MSTDTRERLRKAYSRAADEYDRNRLVDPRGRMLSEFDLSLFLSLFPQEPPPTRVLEAGAGTGRFTIPLLQRGYSIHATDINDVMLAELREKVNRGGFSEECSVAVDNIFQLGSADESFDLVFSFHVIPRMHALDDQKVALRELARVLKPGGTLIFNYRNRRSFYGILNKGHAATPKQIASILDELQLRVITKRGKWLTARRTLDRLPLFMGRILIGIDRCLTRFWPDRAWDVVIKAMK